MSATLRGVHHFKCRHINVYQPIREGRGNSVIAHAGGAGPSIPPRTGHALGGSLGAAAHRRRAAAEPAQASLLGSAESAPAARATAWSGHTRPAGAQHVRAGRPGRKMRAILCRGQRANIRPDRHTGGGATQVTVRSRRRDSKSGDAGSMRSQWIAGGCPTRSVWGVSDKNWQSFCLRQVPQIRGV
jgi:hypothetical protein